MKFVTSERKLRKYFNETNTHVFPKMEFTREFFNLPPVLASLLSSVYRCINVRCLHSFNQRSDTLRTEMQHVSREFYVSKLYLMAKTSIASGDDDFIIHVETT